MDKKNPFTGEYHHVYNRGVDKRNIIIDDRDFLRLLSTFILLQGSWQTTKFSRYVLDSVNHPKIDNKIVEKIKTGKLVELVSFILMPNHFHLLLRELEEGGMSKYMQRTAIAYTKYFNAKYSRAGHLFSGNYKSNHIDTNEQLLYTSAYVHLNTRDLKNWVKKDWEYPWSSYGDFVKENRWGDLLKTEIIMEQFKSSEEYKDFVQSSIIKMDK